MDCVALQDLKPYGNSGLALAPQLAEEALQGAHFFAGQFQDDIPRRQPRGAGRSVPGDPGDDQAAELLDVETRLARDDFDVSFDYIGSGYGQVSPGGLEAIALLARTEGILVDPIYSGKAMAGLIDHIRHGRFRDGDNVVFIHTGGTPALFAYSDDLAAGIAARTL